MSMTPDTPLTALPLTTAAGYLGTSPAVIMRLVRDGDVSAIRIGSGKGARVYRALEPAEVLKAQAILLAEKQASVVRQQAKLAVRPRRPAPLRDTTAPGPIAEWHVIEQRLARLESTTNECLALLKRLL